MSLQHERIYLAGPLDGQRIAQARAWRTSATRTLSEHGLGVFNPMRDQYAGDNAGHISYYDVGGPYSEAKFYTRRDYLDVRRCDGIIANFTDAERISKGTLAEIAWAYALNKPIVLVWTRNNVNWHPMYEEMATLVCGGVEDAAHKMAHILGATCRVSKSKRSLDRIEVLK